MTAPLVPPTVDLRDFPDVYVDVREVMSGSLSRLDDDAFRAAFTLQLKCWHQVPAASLPNCDRALARLAEVSLRRWQRLKPSALVEFVLCSDDRYYHRGLAIRTERAWERKQAVGRRTIRRIEAQSDFWAALRSQVFRGDGFTCQYCGSRDRRLECDHIIPVVKGGLTLESNLITACAPCNRSEGSKLLSEWRR